MPNLVALGKRGVVFARHHSVYPTVTRVNASSISTGAYPERHGLMGNSVFFPKVDPAKFLDTSNRGDLLKIVAAEGQLLTAATLGQSLQAAGRKMLVVSSGSTGSAFLNNHTVSGGAILHPDFTLPESLGADMKALGPRPAGSAPVGSARSLCRRRVPQDRPQAGSDGDRAVARRARRDGAQQRHRRPGDGGDSQARRRGDQTAARRAQGRGPVRVATTSGSRPTTASPRTPAASICPRC